uniref:Reverse transcriptase domain-containing protein n=1 Tax=Tanacetum cinerariifolium TaxID=118510 RepID=A0A699GY58_TANCI|nr:reverse transcriptase domain-containing protein [Tanacetum cinerariifolium]
MSNCSSAKNLFLPLDNPELTIRRRSRTDPTLLNNSEIAAKGNGDLPVPDLRTMEELCQPSLNGRVGPITLIAIQATNFGLKNDMIQQVENSCQFHGLPSDDANKHLDKFLHVTQSIKVNGVTDDTLRLYLFPYSLTHHSTAWFDRLPSNSINAFEQMAKMFLGGTFRKRRPKECYLLRAMKLVVVFIPSMIVPPSLATLKMYMLHEPTKDMVHPTNNRSTEDVQPPVILTESPILNSQPVISPIIEIVASPVSDPKPNQRPSIPYPSRLQDQKLRDKANDQREKFFQIFKDLNFNISFANALILMPKFGPPIKSLLTNKDKLFKLARTPLNEHCLAVLLTKFLEKLRDPGKFLISCDFPRMVECLALADLGASINLMSLFVLNIRS